MDLVVSPAVLIPRPETEHVVEAVLELVSRDGLGLEQKQKQEQEQEREEEQTDQLPLLAGVLHTLRLPSSVTYMLPSLPMVTPTGRPHTWLSAVTKPVRKSSYSPVAWPFFMGIRMTS